MKKVFIMLFLFATTAAVAQFDPSYSSSNRGNLDFDLQVGSSFGTTFGQGSAFNYYFMPSLRKPITPKLTLSTGVIFSQTNFNNLNFFPIEGQFQHQNFSPQLNQFTYFVNAQQQLSEKLFMSGTLIYEKNFFPGNSMMQQRNFDSQGLMMDFTYKVNDNFSFGAGFRYSNNNNQFMNLYNPYYSPNFIGPR